MKRNKPADDIDGDHGIDDHDLPSAKKAKYLSPIRAVTVESKLGVSTVQFLVADLERLQYFKNQLSGRWENDETITITDKELNFGVEEIRALIHYKRRGAIDIVYSCRRILHFCHAADYFAETIESGALLLFLARCAPSITPSQLHELKLASGDCVEIGAVTLLKNAIEKRQESDEKFAMESNQEIIALWRNVKIEFLTCNEYIAANIFANNFRMHSKRHVVLIEEIRCVDHVRTLWKFLCENRLWRKFPCMQESIVTCIDEMKNCTLKMDENRIAVLIDILLDIWDLERNCNIRLDVDTFFTNVCTALESKWIIRFIQGIKTKLESSKSEGWSLWRRYRVYAALGSSLSLWFEHCLPSEEQWILGEFADNLARDNLQQLVKMVRGRIVNHSSDVSASTVDETKVLVYVAFLNKHTTLNWVLHKPEHDFEKKEQQQQG